MGRERNPGVLTSAPPRGLAVLHNPDVASPEMSPDVLARPGTMGGEKPSRQEPGSGKGTLSSDSPLFPSRLSLLLLLRDPYLPQALYPHFLVPPKFQLCPGLQICLGLQRAETALYPNSRPSHQSFVISESPKRLVSHALLHSPMSRLGVGGGGEPVQGPSNYPQLLTRAPRPPNLLPWLLQASSIISLPQTPPHLPQADP